GSTYHGLKSMIEFMTFNFSMQDLLRFCIKTIWDKGLEREQNVGVPIYGERSDLLISEVAGLRVAAAMLSAVKEAFDITVVSRRGNIQKATRYHGHPVGIQGIKVNVSGHVGVSRSSLFKSFSEMAKWLGLANWVTGQNGASVTAGALID
ncbi:hypothetical protein Tco_1125897, partial [Tanacetum coccineum]